MIIPTRGRVVVKMDDEITETEGGVLLPTTARDDPELGRIVNIGAAYLDPGSGEPLRWTFEVGDHVVVEASHGRKLQDGGEEFLLIDGSQILAVVT